MRCSRLIWFSPEAPSAAPLAVSTTSMLKSWPASHSASRAPSQSAVSAIV